MNGVQADLPQLDTLAKPDNASVDVVIAAPHPALAHGRDGSDHRPTAIQSRPRAIFQHR
jgi:hypothetical protein